MLPNVEKYLQKTKFTKRTPQVCNKQITGQAYIVHLALTKCAHQWQMSNKHINSGSNYEGRSVNKLRNGVILLIYKWWKFWNKHFVADLIPSTS